MNLCSSLRQKFKRGNPGVGGRDSVAAALDASGKGLKADPRGGWLPRWLTAEHPLPWLAPMVATLLAFGVYPLLYSVWLSFQQRNRLTRSYEFVGLDQWRAAFADERLWHALGVTFTYTLAALAVQLVLGMALALLLDSDRRVYGILRALMTLPLVVPPAVTGMMFLLMQDGQFGVLDYYFTQLGLIDASRPMLGTASTALIGLMLADVWQWTPFMFVILLAGLTAIPPHLYEAAEIDGVSAWQVFWFITIPQLAPMMLLAITFRLLDSVKIFDIIFMITGGAPGTRTYTASFYLYQIGFQQFHLSQATAGSWILLALTALVITLLVRRLMREEAT
jgi:multiple sugar transport system permease protein